MSLMLVADIVVAHARSTAAESCPAGESCMLLMLEADAAAAYARSAVAVTVVIADIDDARSCDRCMRTQRCR
jgi:hypothetical protein